MIGVPEGVRVELVIVQSERITYRGAGDELGLGCNIHRRRELFFNEASRVALKLVFPQGMTTIEHALPIPVLYDDILTLYAESGTGATPTHIVNYGGAMGEEFIWANQDIPNNPKSVTGFNLH